MQSERYSRLQGDVTGDCNKRQMVVCRRTLEIKKRKLVKAEARIKW